jgi:hypothetical protein
MFPPLHAVEGCTPPGRRLFREPLADGVASRLRNAVAVGLQPRRVRGLHCDGHLPGEGPHAGHPCPSDGAHPRMDVCASGAQLAVAGAQPSWRLPTAILQRVRPHCESPRELAAHRGRLAVRLGPGDEGPPGRGVARFGEASLAPAVSPGSFRGEETASTHELSGVVNTGAVAQFRHEGDRHGALDAAEALECLAYRLKTPGLHLLNRGDVDRGAVPRAPPAARWMAARRWVLTRSPACWGLKAGATTPQTGPFGVRERERQ